MNRILFTQKEIEDFFIPNKKLPLLKKEFLLHSNTPITLKIPCYDFRIQHIKNILQIHPLPIKENILTEKTPSLHAGIINASMGNLFIFKEEYEYIFAKYIPQHCKIISNKKHLTMIIAHPRPPILKRMLRDLSTFGVHHIIIYSAALSEKSYANSSVWNTFLKTILIGAMQAKTLNVIPKIYKHTTLNNALKELKNIYNNKQLLHPMKIVFSQNAKKHFTDIIHKISLNNYNKHFPSLVACIGPERGFTSKEEKNFKKNEFILCKLCSPVLRCENAALLAAGIYLNK